MSEQAPHREPPYEGIWNIFKTGEIIPFIGAGASLSSVANPQIPQVPSGRELGEELARTANFPSSEPTRDLPKVAQYYIDALTRPLLRAQLHKRFEPKFPLLSLHQFLAKVPANLLIITTNYDDLIERAFQAVSRAYHLVVHPTDNKDWAASVIHWKPNDPNPEFVSSKKLHFDLTEASVIYKMHGNVDRLDAHRDSFVITEDDYADFIVRVAKENAIPSLFAEPLKTRPLLYLGYSLSDWNFRVILRRIKQDQKSWAIQKGPTLVEQFLWEKRHVDIFDMTIDEFVEKICAQIPRA